MLKDIITLCHCMQLEYVLNVTSAIRSPRWGGVGGMDAGSWGEGAPNQKSRLATCRTICSHDVKEFAHAFNQYLNETLG